MLDLIKEVVSVGVIVVIVGVLLHMISLYVYGPHDLNDMKMYIVHLFCIGVVVHLFCEFTGVNKWYCKNGVACKA